MSEGNPPKVMFLYFSFSGQTASLLGHIISGLKDHGIDVHVESLKPVAPLRFPLSSIPATIKMMLSTLFRKRIPINKLTPPCFGNYDLVILAGPTWSYNPSGPVLSVIDRDGSRLFSGKQVLPLISCRGYWRTHWFGLKRMLKKCGADVPNCMVFSHLCAEPWRTIGVFLKIAGKKPEQLKRFGRLYTSYGHSKEQRDEAWRFGMQIGEALRRSRPLSELDFRTPKALP